MKISLDLDVSYLGKTLDTVFPSPRDIFDLRFAERGKREPATVSATGRKKPSGSFLGHVWDEHLGI